MKKIKNLLWKVSHCKCPHCKQHGIFIFDKWRRRRYRIYCRKCGKEFVHSPLTYLIDLVYCVVFMLLWFLLDKLNFEHTPKIKAVIGTIVLYLVTYHTPLKEKKNKISPVAMEREEE